VVTVWVLAAIAAVVVVATADPSARWTLYPLVLSGAVIGTFVLQLAVGEKQGFVTRLMLSTVGALAAIVVVSTVGALIP
jgi:hypothetical protein